MNTKNIFPKPEQNLSVLRRYLHILALIQNNKDPQNWNGNRLSEILTDEENFNGSISDKGVSDKTVRGYIAKELKDYLGLDIDMEKGGRRIELDTPLDENLLFEIMNIYSTFVITDSGNSIILKKFIKKHPYDCLWMLGRLYFASMFKQRIIFDYENNAGEKRYDCKFNPYFVIMKNNNLYLYGKAENQDRAWLLILSRISNLKFTDDFFKDDVPTPDDVFKDTLGSFVNEKGERYKVVLEFNKKIYNTIEQILSILDPVITETKMDQTYRAEFILADAAYLCKQLFLYGNDVEIIEPVEVRDMMISMLKESLSVYK